MSNQSVLVIIVVVLIMLWNKYFFLENIFSDYLVMY